MKRRVRGVMWACLAGVLSTAIVAAACAWRGRQFVDAADVWTERLSDPKGGIVQEVNGRAPEGTQYLEMHIYHRFGVSFGTSRLRPFQNYTSAGPPPNRTRPESVASRWQRAELLPWVAGSRPWPDPKEGDGVWVKASGWPLRCLVCNLSTKDAPNFGSHTWSARGGLILSNPTFPGWSDWPPMYPHVLPFRPMWPELIGNTVVFGAAWWLLGWTWFAVRDRGRRSRGRCTGCGFDLVGLAPGSVCPECGRAR